MLKKLFYLTIILFAVTACENKVEHTENQITNNSKPEVEELKSPWISAYENELEKYVIQYGNDFATISYYLVDIDKNKIPELIIKTGDLESVTIADIFTFTDKIENIGNFSMKDSLLFATNNKSITRQSTNGTLEYIYNLTIDSSGIVEELIEENDYSSQEDFTFKTFENEINSYSISDYTPIENFRS